MSKEKSAIEVLKQAQHAIKALQRHIQYLERQLEGKGSSASLQERVDTIKFHTNLDFNKTNKIFDSYHHFCTFPITSIPLPDLSPLTQRLRW